MVICSQHSSCYVQDSLDSHLALSHKVPRKRRLHLLLELSVAGLAMRRSDVLHPPDSIAPINSLPVLCGY